VREGVVIGVALGDVLIAALVALPRRTFLRD
jgi:hypothetical protein